MFLDILNHYWGDTCTKTTIILIRTKVATLLGKALNPLAVLNESNFLGIATEALSAAHEPILPDQPMRVPTYTASTRTRPVVLGVRIPNVGVTHD